MISKQTLFKSDLNEHRRRIKLQQIDLEMEEKYPEPYDLGGFDYMINKYRK